VGVVEGWTSYREFWFLYNDASIQDSERAKLTEIATYLRQNPSLQICVDGSMDPRGTDPRNTELSDRRVKNLCDALIKEGVSANRIVTGSVGDTELRRDRRVEVLIASAK